MDWKAKANEEGQKNAERIPEGVARGVVISKVLHGTKNDGFFVTKGGDRQIMVIVADNQDREAATMFTLSEKVAWALAKLCEAAGLDLDKMTKAGIGIEKFQEEAFAKKNLEGRKLDVEIRHNGKYTNFSPLRPESDGDFAQAGASKSDDIPI